MASPAQLKTTGLLLLVSFFAVLFAIFMPLFPGTAGGKVNGLDYLDNFFNQLSKSSAFYIKDQQKKAEAFKGEAFDMTLKLKNEKFKVKDPNTQELKEVELPATVQAEAAAKVFAAHGVKTSVETDTVKISGNDFGGMLATILDDAVLLYNNQGDALQAKYGIDARLAFYSFYQTLAVMEKDQTKKEKFDRAKFIKGVSTKAIEPAYNYYQVEATPVKEEMVLLIAALAFYVIYTMWYGFGLLYLFEGLGIKLDH
ncbi:hypothetical protein [Desulfobulbus sp.]|uniref:hypothetical protein n=1 Tax=Desulfobulbus sp. TaxID=895 RepID=UPI00286EB7A8|nr:hypothetical protein [Desulfobulbus sp.]